MPNTREPTGSTLGPFGNAGARTEANPLLRPLLDALDDPALLIEGGIVRIANPAARELLGRTIEGSDIRIAIRQPRALEFLLAGRPGELEISGIGDLGRP